MDTTGQMGDQLDFVILDGPLYIYTARPSTVRHMSWCDFSL